MKTALRRILPYLLLLFILAGGVVVWLQRDALRDWWVLRSYDPPAVIAQLATDTAMSPYAERLFFVNKPAINDKVALNDHCADLAHEYAVLGCFKGDRLGIYIYDITDERLHGVEQVTAAHEMLHQAYERLNAKERERVDGLLDDYYLHHLTDQSIKDKMEGYKQTEPSELTNEMHSIFGTEIADLPEELETYYAQYFSDRQKVVGFRVQSQAAFDEYSDKIATLDAKLNELRPVIEASQASMEDQLQVINQRKAALNSLLAAENIQAYNAGVPEVQALVKAYNRQLLSTNDQIEEYNRVLAERKEIAIQANQLGDALDSRLTPQ